MDSIDLVTDKDTYIYIIYIEGYMKTTLIFSRFLQFV